MAKYKRIPITAAENIADSYDKDQVVILAWDKTHNCVHAATYGKTKADCKQAADWSKLLLKASGIETESSPET